MESKNGKLSSEEIENSFASNTCRCTGFRPIVDAFKSFAKDADERLLKLVDIEDLNVSNCNLNCKHRRLNTDVLRNEDEASWCIIEETNKPMLSIYSDSYKWHKAYSLEDIFKIIQNNNNYKLIAGNTGQGMLKI